MILHLILSLILSIETIIIIDFAMVLKGIHFKLSLYGISLLSQFILLAFCSDTPNILLFTLAATLFLIPWVMYLLWLPFAKTSHDFEDVDNGKTACYGNKKVLLIVPHQDDEINVLGGIFEEFIKYGSTVHIVYAITNGTIQGFRYTEALNLCKHIGIPDSNVTFLGYGFIHSKKANIPTVTKGTQNVPAYKEGQALTREKMVNDLKEIILLQKPDIIFGSDYDYHEEHHLVTIAIDEALGKVLKSKSKYRPMVMKSYAYRTTWESYPDYYKNNIRSTLYKKATVETYPWEERLRLPIAAHLLNRSLLRSDIFRQYKTFKSQRAAMRAINFNADKVAWQRRSDSLLLQATIQVSSGKGSKLNDFLLYDKSETFMLNRDSFPTEGAWIPEETDKEKKVTFTLANPSRIEYLLLYQNTWNSNVVEKVSISFNNEKPTQYSLRTDGYPTRIHVRKEDVDFFTIRIINSRGANAGLTEVEAFECKEEQPFSLIKLMNTSEDFVYDYWINTSGEESFLLYAKGDALPLSAADYSISVDNPKCKAFIIGAEIKVYCPKGEQTRLIVTSVNSLYSDTVILSNPNKMKRLRCAIGQKTEAIYYGIFIGDTHRKATSLSILSMIKSHLCFIQK